MVKNDGVIISKNKAREIAQTESKINKKDI